MFLTHYMIALIEVAYVNCHDDDDDDEHCTSVLCQDSRPSHRWINS